MTPTEEIQALKDLYAKSELEPTSWVINFAAAVSVFLLAILVVL